MRHPDVIYGWYPTEMFMLAVTDLTAALIAYRHSPVGAQR